MSRNLPISNRISVEVQQLFEDLIVVKCNVNNKEFQGILLNTSKSFFGINESRLKGGAENWTVTDGEKANISFSCSAERYSYKIDGSGPTILTRHPVKRHKSPPLSGKHVICHKCQSVVTIPADPSAETSRRPSTSETDPSLSELASCCPPNRRKSSMHPRRLSNFDTRDNFDSSVFKDLPPPPPAPAAPRVVIVEPPPPAAYSPKLVKKKKKKDRVKERMESSARSSEELRHKLKKRKLESNIERIPLKKSKLFDSEAKALQAQAIHAVIPGKSGRGSWKAEEEGKTARPSEGKPKSSKRLSEDPKASKLSDEKAKISKVADEEKKVSKSLDEKIKASKVADEEKKVSKSLDEKIKASKVADEEKKTSKSLDEKTKGSKVADEEKKVSKSLDEKTKGSKRGDENKKSSKFSEEKAKSSKRTDDEKKISKSSKIPEEEKKVSKASKIPEEEKKVSKTSKIPDEEKKVSNSAEEKANSSKRLEEEANMPKPSDDKDKVLQASEDKEKAPKPGASSSLRSEDDKSSVPCEQEASSSSRDLDKGLKKLKRRLDAEKKVKRRQRALQKELAELGEPPLQVNGERPRRGKVARLEEQEQEQEQEQGKEKEEEEAEAEVSSVDNPPDSSLSLKIKINRTPSADNGGYECRILADDSHAAVSSSCDPPPPPAEEEEEKALARCTLLSGACFAVNDIVWAKITGYPWWPARITAIQHAKAPGYTAEVLWFNWDQISFIPCDKLFPFLEHYAAKCDKKRKGAYRSAVEQAWMAAQAAQSFADDDEEEEAEVRFDSYGQCLSRPSSSGLLASPVSSSSAPPPEQHESAVSSSLATQHESSDEEAESGLVIDTDTPRVP